MEKTLLEYSEEKNSILGQGGSGTIIYRARYCDQPVAIKRFHIKKWREQSVDSDTGTVLKGSVAAGVLLYDNGQLTGDVTRDPVADAGSSSLDAMLKHLQSSNALRSFSEFRQEASILHSLHHPCIVSLVGISIHPLCFALELAPLGSLNTVLEEKRKGKQQDAHLVHFQVVPKLQ